MGGIASKVKRIGFEELIQSLSTSILINTLPIKEQDILISSTVHANDEISRVEHAIKNHTLIIIYGRNSRDDTVYTKYEQLWNMGHKQLAIYTGGLFEWLLLQDIYGHDKFPTTSKTLDLLKFR